MCMPKPDQRSISFEPSWSTWTGKQPKPRSLLTLSSQPFSVRFVTLNGQLWPLPEDLPSGLARSSNLSLSWKL